MKHRLIFFLCCFLGTPLWAHDPYDVFTALATKGNLPRLLNSEDFPALRPGDPQPLFAPEGDFNDDGLMDIALSGLYDLDTREDRYFLLIATKKPDSPKFIQLFYQEYSHPVFIHKTGTTGEGDPGDQIFSVAYCTNCDEGVDFYWNKKKKKFTLKKWTTKRMKYTKAVQVRPAEVPQADLLSAIKIVSNLKDVQNFVLDVEKKGNKIKTTVNFSDNPSATSEYVVRLFEVGKKKQKLYDEFTVNVGAKEILKRKKIPLR